MPLNHNAISPRRWIKRSLLIAVVLAVAGYFLRNVILGTPVATYEAVRSDLVQTVVASGRIMTP